MSSTIASYFGLDRLDGLLYGLELEIEHASPHWADGTEFEAKEDGSLRNSGWEFISAPESYDVIVKSLNKFFDRASKSASDYYLIGNENNYSERTSIHVHTNCLDLTLQQVGSIFLLYQVTEDLLFEWIGNDRKDNIFCVPWSQTNLNYDIVNRINSFVNSMSVDRNKYTALNLVPLKDLGTIEWRHMYGTNNMDVITRWLRIIGHFYRIAREYPLEAIEDRLKNLNTNSHYDLFLDWLFAEEANSLRLPDYQTHLEEGVINMKYAIINKGKPVKKAKTAPLDELVRMYEAQLTQQVPPPPPTFTPPQVAGEMFFLTEAPVTWRERIDRVTAAPTEGTF